MEVFPSLSPALSTEDGHLAKQPVGQSVALALHVHHATLAQLVAAQHGQQATVLAAAVYFQLFAQGNSSWKLSSCNALTTKNIGSFAPIHNYNISLKDETIGMILKLIFILLNELWHFFLVGFFIFCVRGHYKSNLIPFKYYHVASFYY